MFTKDQVDDIILGFPTLLPGGRKACAFDVHQELQGFLEEYVYPWDNDRLEDFLEYEWMGPDDYRNATENICHKLSLEYVPDEDSKNGQFIIFYNCQDIGRFQQEWNRRFCSLAYAMWADKYIKMTKDDEHPWMEMRLNRWQSAKPKHDDHLSPYLVPSGLEDLDDICDYGLSDEYTTCNECGSLIHTEPEYHGWQPRYHIFDSVGYVCDDCICRDYAEEYIEAHTNKNSLLNSYIIDPDEHGWIELEGLDFENGMHHGQNADPKRIIAILNKTQIDCLFTGRVGQFDVSFNVWIPTWAMICEDNPDTASDLEMLLGQYFFEESDDSDEKDLMWMDWVRGYLEDANTNLPYDQTAEFAKALRGDGSEHIKVVKTTYGPDGVTVDSDWKKEK